MNIQKLVAINKFILNRGHSYAGTISIGFIATSILQDHYPFSEIPIYFLFPLGIFGIWIIGLIDVKYDFLKEEQKYIVKKNPLSYHNLINKDRNKL